MTLTQNIVRALLDCDYEAGTLTWRYQPYATGQRNGRWAGRPAFTRKDKDGYKCGEILGKKYLAHRVIFLHAHGYLPEEVDHENGNPGDNRISNLRPATRSVNQRNKKKMSNNTSGITGVSYNKASRKYEAKVKCYGKRHYLGMFATPEEAGQAVIAKRKELGGFTDRHGI